MRSTNKVIVLSVAIAALAIPAAASASEAAQWLVNGKAQSSPFKADITDGEITAATPGGEITVSCSSFGGGFRANDPYGYLEANSGTCAAWTPGHAQYCTNAEMTVQSGSPFAPFKESGEYFVGEASGYMLAYISCPGFPATMFGGHFFLPGFLAGWDNASHQLVITELWAESWGNYKQLNGWLDVTASNGAGAMTLE